MGGGISVVDLVSRISYLVSRISYNVSRITYHVSRPRGSRVPGHEQPTSDACEERERGLARHQRCVFVSPPFIREIFLKREYFFYYLKCEHRPLVLSHRLLPARRQKALVVGELGSWTTLAPFPPTPSHTHTHTHTPPRTHTHTHTHTHLLLICPSFAVHQLYQDGILDVGVGPATTASRTAADGAAETSRSEGNRT